MNGIKKAPCGNKALRLEKFLKKRSKWLEIRGIRFSRRCGNRAGVRREAGENESEQSWKKVGLFYCSSSCG